MNREDVELGLYLTGCIASIVGLWYAIYGLGLLFGPFIGAGLSLVLIFVYIVLMYLILLGRPKRKQK